MFNKITEEIILRTEYLPASRHEGRAAIRSPGNRWAMIEKSTKIYIYNANQLSLLLLLMFASFVIRQDHTCESNRQRDELKSSDNHQGSGVVQQMVSRRRMDAAGAI